MSYKRGRSHVHDSGAYNEYVRITGPSRAVQPGGMLAAMENRVVQMGEWVRFPNGDLACYFDIMIPGSSFREGMHSVRSTGNTVSFNGPTRTGTIDGVELGYPFQFIVDGEVTYMLAMTFSNLTGGSYIGLPAPGHAGSVYVLKSTDSGASWRIIRNMTVEFGNAPINESTFAKTSDGFVFVTRGYDNRARIHTTNHSFELVKQLDLTANYDFIRSYIGRPRIFEREGNYYVIGRNWDMDSDPAIRPEAIKGFPSFPPAMELCLFRISKSSLGVESYTILDNVENQNVTEGYYASPYFRIDKGITKLFVIDYKGVDRRPPQVVEFEYNWDEVK